MSTMTTTKGITMVRYPVVVFLLVFLLVGAPNAQARGPQDSQFLSSVGRPPWPTSSFPTLTPPTTSTFTYPTIPTLPPDSDNTNNGGSGSGSGSGSSGSNNGGSGGSGFGLENNNGGAANYDYSYYREIHGILAAIAIVGLLPLGAVLVRVVPSRFAWLVHALTQVVGYIMFVAAAVMGLYLVNEVKIGRDGGSLLTNPQTNTHPIIGIIILVLLSLQPGLGLIHHLRYKRVFRRTAWSHLHIWIGRAAVTLGIVNGGLGLGLARASKPAVAAYAVVSAIVWLIWFAVAVWGEVAAVRRRRRENERDGDGGRLRGGSGRASAGNGGVEAKGLGGGGGGGGSNDGDRNADASSAVGASSADGSTMVPTTTGGSSSIGNSNSDRGQQQHLAGVAHAHAHAHHSLVPPIFPPARPETPSPPYTPGPVGSAEWTVYGGPGLNNTPRGNRTSEVSPVSPVSAVESEKGHFGRD